MTIVMPYKNPEDTNKAMREYRKRQAAEDAEKDEWIRDVQAQIDGDEFEEFVQEQLSQGYTWEQIEGYLKTYVLQEPDTPVEEPQPVATAADSTCSQPEETEQPKETIIKAVKPDCFAKQKPEDSKHCTCSWHGDCSKEWGRLKVEEIFKRPEEKERERRQKIVDLLVRTRDFATRSAKEDLDSRIKLVTDSQTLNAELEKRHPDYPKASDLKKRTRGDEYGKPFPLYSRTVPSVYGKTPWQVRDQMKKEKEEK
jgi:hypothetical protein